MAWSPHQVGNILRLYVDQTARIVAIGRRISGALQTVLQTAALAAGYSTSQK